MLKLRQVVVLFSAKLTYSKHVNPSKYTLLDMNLKEIKREIYIYTSSLVLSLADDYYSGGLYSYTYTNM